MFISVVLPVLSQQGEDLTLLEGQVNMIVGQDAGKTFGDTA
jgi:hypothetical protein